MSSRFAPFMVIPAVLAAVFLGLWGVDHGLEATASTSHGPPTPQAAVGELLPREESETLPPNHPAIGAARFRHESLAPSGDEAPALGWKMSASWQDASSPKAMRLATYHAPGGVEVSVSRAGGTTEANIQRWISQFDDVGREDRAERTVHGLHVVTIAVAGTYIGGGMAMGGPPEPKHGWALVGAIVASRSPSYFFKMTGPADAVRASRAAFDRMLDGVTPM